jgi:hypothetical protein
VLEQESTSLQTRLTHINGKLKPLDSLLEQKARLQKLAADSGADLAEVAQQLQEKEIELARQRNARDAIASKIAGELSTIAALQGKTAMPEPDAQRSMRRALNDAGIGHAMLSDIVEVTDPRWQGAIEGVLGGYASVVLLDKSSDASAAYRLAEKERYRHFIVPDLVHAPTIKDDSLMSVVKFSAKVPSWLVEQLSRITRVDNVDAGAKLRAATMSGSRRKPITANAAAAARCSWKRRVTASAAGRIAAHGSDPEIAAGTGSAGRHADPDRVQAGDGNQFAEDPPGRRGRGQGTGRAPGGIRRSGAQRRTAEAKSAPKSVRAWASCKT